MKLPTIHLNGTSKQRLIEELMEQSEALRTVLEVLARTGPNARDYYPQGPGAFEVADNEHTARIRKVFEVKQEVDDLMLEIDKL